MEKSVSANDRQRMSGLFSEASRSLAWNCRLDPGSLVPKAGPL